MKTYTRTVTEIVFQPDFDSTGTVPLSALLAAIDAAKREYHRVAGVLAEGDWLRLRIDDNSGVELVAEVAQTTEKSAAHTITKRFQIAAAEVDE